MRHTSVNIYINNSVLFCYQFSFSQTTFICWYLSVKATNLHEQNYVCLFALQWKDHLQLCLFLFFFKLLKQRKKRLAKVYQSLG